jgi:cytochrome c-type biogenesis protein
LEVLSGVLIVLFGALLVAMAAGVTLPMALSGEKRFIVRPSVLGAWAPPVMGMAFAFAWTPCIGPVLGSVLALAAGTGGSASGGIALLLAYSLGLGVPFLLSGMAFGRMTDLLARVRGRLRIVDLVGGIILVAFGLVLLTGNVDVLSAHISTWLRDLHLDRLSTS